MPKPMPHHLADVQSALILWLTWLLGPLAWALHQNVSFVLMDWVCETGNYGALHLVSLGALAIAGAGGALAWRSWHIAVRPRSGPAARTWPRVRFMATGGAAICAISFVGIVVESIPNFVLDACARAT